MNLLRTSPFFESQRRGRWKWPWLLLGIVLSALAGVVTILAFDHAIGIVSEWMELSWAKDYLESETYTTPTQLSLMLLAIGISCWVAAMVGTSVQGRSIRSLVAPLRPFRWGLAAKSALLASSLMIILNVISIPGTSHLAPTLEFTGLRLEHALWFVPMLLCVLLQTSGEEALFRGYLLRQLGAVTLVRWIAPVVVVSVFTSLHLSNDDMTDNQWIIIPWFVIGELLVIYLLMRSGSMEIPVVLHWINNSWVFLVVAEKGVQSNDLTLWVYEKAGNEAAHRASDIESLASSLIFGGLLLLAFCWRRSPFYVPPMAEQDGTDQPATAPESKPEGEESSEPESEARPQ